MASKIMNARDKTGIRKLKKKNPIDIVKKNRGTTNAI